MKHEEKKKKFPNDTSLMQGNGYVFESNDTIQLVCYKWSKKMKKQNRRDQLFLSLNDSEYELWVIENIN